MRVFGEAYPVSCPRYRCPVQRARSAAGGRDAGEGVDRRPGVDVYREPVHADAEVRGPVTRRGPPVPDRVLASGFSGRGLIGRVHVRAGDRAVRADQQNRPAESVVRRRSILPTIPPTAVQGLLPLGANVTESAPNDHLTAGPDCRVIGSARGRVEGADACPTVRAGIVSSASAKPCVWETFYSTPDDHFAAGPDRRVSFSAGGSIGGTGGCPTVCGWIVSSASVRTSTPNDHFAASPDCRVIHSARGRVGGAGGYPTIRAGIVSPAGVVTTGSTPNDHFSAGPDCRVNGSRSGRVSRAGGCPTIRAGIVSPTSVQIGAVATSAPDDHFSAGPDCRVGFSGSGRVSRAGGCPTISAGIVSAAGVQ